MNVQRWVLTIVIIVLVAFAWHQVFVMTGILWWNAPEPDVQLTAPDPVEYGKIDASWVDIESWHRTHPVWPALR